MNAIQEDSARRWTLQELATLPVFASRRGGRWAIDPQDCNPALRKLGAIVEVDGRYKIAPWVIEAGMMRKPKLDSSDDILIKNSTLKPGDKPSERLITQEELALEKEARRVGEGIVDPSRRQG